MNHCWVVIMMALVAFEVDAHESHPHHHQVSDEVRPQPLSGQSIYNIESTWTDQNGKSASLSALQGKPTVVAMVYTSCQAACPLTFSDLKKIEEELPVTVRSEVRFAVFSFDTKRDTPAKLKQVAEARSLDTRRWTLFHGDASAVRKLSALLGIRYKMDKNGDFDHSNVITVLDRAGVIAHQQVGLRQDPRETVSKLVQLSRN